MKNSKLFFFAALFGALSTLLVILYLKRDQLKDCPFCQRFKKQDYDFDSDFDFEDEEEVSFEEEEKEPVPVKENKQKVRRGYIPLKLHEAN